MSEQVRFPSIEGLRAFEAAARLGSFERAAEGLSITASAVSKRVATLEDLLGAPLFSRGAKTLALTPIGKEYLGQVSVALGVLAAMPLHQKTVQRLQRLRVSAPPTFARQILVPNLEQFSAKHPGIELEVVLSIPYLDAGHNDADVQVTFAEDLPASDSAGPEPLMRDVVTPMVAPSLLERLAPLRSPSDLSHAPLLRTPLEPWMPWFTAAGLSWAEPTQGPRLVDLGLTLEAAVCGQGVALARPGLALHWLASGALVAPFDVVATPKHQYCVSSTSHVGAPAAFTAWMREACMRVVAQSQALLSRTG